MTGWASNSSLICHWGESQEPELAKTARSLEERLQEKKGLLGGKRGKVESSRN